MTLKFSNFGKAVISSAPSGTSGLSFTVEAGKGLLFPALGSGDYFYGIFKDASGNREVVKIDARSTDAMTIATGGRGLDGTTARTWAAGDYFVAGIVNIALQESLSNTNLSALGALTSAADQLPYFTGSGAAAVTTITAAARTLLDDATVAAMRATLDVPTLAEATASAFASGTKMLFAQATAPTGWVQDTTAGLNHALRVVGTTQGGTTGGTIAFTTAFAAQSVSGSVGYHNLTIAEIPPHTHSLPFESGTITYPIGGSETGKRANSSSTTGSTGSGAGHTHSFSGTDIDLTVRYVNIMMATKS